MKQSWIRLIWNYFWIFLAAFGFFMNLSILTPVIPLYANLLGATEAIIGVIIGIFPAAALVVRINIDPYANQRSKMLLVLG